MAQEEPIRLFLRLRPPQHKEKFVYWSNSGSTISGELGTFSADSVYGEGSSNGDIFKTSVVPIVEKCCQGYNTALMAYGQSGSGKTHTVLGDAKDEGLLPQIITHLFEEVERQQKISDRSFLVLLQMMELYCEKFVDLLGTDSGQKVAVMEEKGGTRVINLKEIPIKTKQQAFELIKVAQERRVVGATELNDQSSRSHVIVQLTVESSMTVAGKSNLKSRRSVMNIVDLAGSENAANNTGLRAKEGANINLSLLTLTRVINILTEKTAPNYIPYRDSNLTRVLKPCLGGNSSTLIICCLDPQNKEETLRTLKFSERLKLVKGQVQVNEEVEGGQLNEYLNEIASLKKALSEQQEAKEEQEAKTKRLLELKNFIIGANEVSKQQTRVIRRQTICASNASIRPSSLHLSAFSPPSKKGRTELKMTIEEENPKDIQAIPEFKISGPEETVEQMELNELRRDSFQQEMEIIRLKREKTLAEEEFQRNVEEEKKRTDELLAAKDKDLEDLKTKLAELDSASAIKDETILNLQKSDAEMRDKLDQLEVFKEDVEIDKKISEEKIATRDETIQNLNEEMARKAEEVEKIKRELDELKSFSTSKDEDIASQKQAIQYLQISLLSTKKENEEILQLKTELTRFEELNGQLAEKEKNLQTEIEEIKKLLKEKDEIVSSQTSELEQLRSQLANERSEDSEDAVERSSEELIMKRKVEELNREMAVKTERIKELGQKLTQMESLSVAKDQDILNLQKLESVMKDKLAQFEASNEKAELDKKMSQEEISTKEKTIEELNKHLTEVQSLLRTNEEALVIQREANVDLQNSLESSKMECESIRQRVVAEIQETVLKKMSGDGERISQLESEVARLSEVNSKMCEEEEQLHTKCKHLEQGAREIQELLKKKDETVANQTLELEHLRQLANENISLRQTLRQKEKEITDKMEAAEHFKRKAQDSVREQREMNRAIKDLEETVSQLNKEIEELNGVKKLSESVHTVEKTNLLKQISEKEDAITKFNAIGRQDKLELIKLKSEIDRKSNEIDAYRKIAENLTAEKASLAETVVEELEKNINDLEMANEEKRRKIQSLEEELSKQKMIAERALREKVLPSFSSDIVNSNELSRLKKENERLQRQIRDMEDEEYHKEISGGNKENTNSEKELKRLKEEIESLVFAQKQRIDKSNDLRKDLDEKEKMIKESDLKLLELKSNYDKGVEMYSDLRNNYDGLKSEAKIVYDKYRNLKETHAKCTK